MRFPRWSQAYREAEQTAQDPGKAQSLLWRVFAKFKLLRRALFLKFVLRELGRIAELVKAWIKGDYRQVSGKTIITALAALIYFLNPLDIIPDWIPLLGLLDEALILAWITKAIGQELDDFETWKSTQTTLPTD